MDLSRFDIDSPRWDQNTFMGRLKHFFNITDCRTVLLSDARLDEAKELVESCRYMGMIRIYPWQMSEWMPLMESKSGC